jgi:hypothetical protein
MKMELFMITKSKKWQLHEAKNRFSEVVRKAFEEGPQTVTRKLRILGIAVFAILGSYLLVRGGLYYWKYSSVSPAPRDFELLQGAILALYLATPLWLVVCFLCLIPPRFLSTKLNVLLCTPGLLLVVWLGVAFFQAASVT